MGSVVKGNIHKFWNNHEQALYFHKSEGVSIDPYHYEEVPDFLTPDECDYLCSIILRDEEEIKAIPNPTTKPYEGLTVQHEVYNWLNNPDLQDLKLGERLLNLPTFQPFKMATLQCWANVLRQNQDLPTHHHHYYPENTLLACNIFLGGREDTGTHYYHNDIGYTRNAVGTLTIVGQRLPHEVKTNIHQTPRISMALDVSLNPCIIGQKRSFTERFCVYYRNDGESNTHECMLPLSSIR